MNAEEISKIKVASYAKRAEPMDEDLLELCDQSVIHYTRLLLDLTQGGRLKITETDTRILTHVLKFNKHAAEIIPKLTSKIRELQRSVL